MPTKTMRAQVMTYRMRKDGTIETSTKVKRVKQYSIEGVTVCEFMQIETPEWIKTNGHQMEWDYVIQRRPKIKIKMPTSGLPSFPGLLTNKEESMVKFHFLQETSFLFYDATNYFSSLGIDLEKAGKIKFGLMQRMKMLVNSKSGDLFIGQSKEKGKSLGGTMYEGAFRPFFNPSKVKMVNGKPKYPKIPMNGEAVVVKRVSKVIIYKGK